MASVAPGSHSRRVSTHWGRGRREGEREGGREGEREGGRERERERGIGRREGEKWREGRGEEEEGETTFLSTHLVDESLAVVDGEQGLVHGVQRRSKVSVAAWNAIRVLCSLRPFPSL